MHPQEFSFKTIYGSHDYTMKTALFSFKSVLLLFLGFSRNRKQRPYIRGSPQEFENGDKCLQGLGEASNPTGRIVLLLGTKRVYFFKKNYLMHFFTWGISLPTPCSTSLLWGGGCLRGLKFLSWNQKWPVFEGAKGSAGSTDWWCFVC